ncbi:aspartate--tRNA ligase msd1 [Friedmanniomyces endolithicus]|uniref:Aspartate--tRNA ligase msd1 n=1 Tax=Friedmanniomyces endolithicus TaxID=329885 RepID=A0AAN6KY44_9PEZI|nr:aspartate--tRNA ligase msd1 [Friedmanniomyces endolithicus]KAK0785200.1 aspartate--tRNA ligase msd1 [Friedmanniomyces endolithicus]KAK0808887.1 aspartate--tRNA ligase msd1 [Friedmanniomyces endolithicus]KAK0816391.1 aspartate--tRNA ligase msd1 [Friedmanniomyces endolithicus]KAK0844718.1 aspartate--tRNA ligase msd1 [Friedmanniomyces endolithicus]
MRERGKILYPGVTKQSARLEVLLRPTGVCSTRQLRLQPEPTRRRGRRPAERCYSTKYPANEVTSPQDGKVLDAFKQSLQFPPASCTFAQIADDEATWIDRQVTLHGYLGTRRIANKGLTFAELHDMSLESVVQIVSTATKHADSISLPHRLLQDLAHHTPVVVEGTLKGRQAPKTSKASKNGAPVSEKPTVITGLELKLENIVPLNTLPDDLILTDDTVFGPNQRHLQIKHDKTIRDALRFRSKAARFIRDHLVDSHGFEEFETPLLFKSTPEGAREFLVPTRSPGLAYALPQSPQQYKQILMASGIPRYMQIAKCFRDEDLRADRQPEFTQVDLEMAFASGEDVMRTVESTVRALWKRMLHIEDLPLPFPRLTYEEAMSRYGSDKPDIRLGSEITRIDYMLPVDLISKIGPHADPIVDVIKLPISKDTSSTREFVVNFMESAEALPFLQNPDGQPGIFIVDSRKPLQGLQPFGFEAAEQVDEMLALEDGDLLVLQARKKLSFAGGSTPLGNLRLALHKAAVKQGFLPAPKGFAFTWIMDFPLFSPNTDSDPGQGGFAGISSTHHPFTAPKSPGDVDLLLTDPLQAKADHYDLVLNGVELGGGSRRIHNAEMQAFILRDILKMSEVRMRDFDHLIEVLRAGCPPHAGMALGFDRLVAVMLGRESVRDVIAFPKSGRGQDLLVKSPTMMTEEQLKTYHLRIRDGE